MWACLVSPDPHLHGRYRRSRALRRCVLGHDGEKYGQHRGEPRGTQELSSAHLLGSDGARLGRKYNWLEVSRSTTSMMPEQDGQRRLGVSGGSTHFAMPS